MLLRLHAPRTFHRRPILVIRRWASSSQLNQLLLSKELNEGFKHVDTGSNLKVLQVTCINFDLWCWKRIIITSNATCEFELKWRIQAMIDFSLKVLQMACISLIWHDAKSSKTSAWKCFKWLAIGSTIPKSIVIISNALCTRFTSGQFFSQGSLRVSCKQTYSQHNMIDYPSPALD